jgi:hypothetical protein
MTAASLSDMELCDLSQGRRGWHGGDAHHERWCELGDVYGWTRATVRSLAP